MDLRYSSIGLATRLMRSICIVRINGYVTAGLACYVGQKTTDWACSAVVLAS